MDSTTSTKMQHDTAGYKVGAEFYPMPTRFRLGDPVLVTELTGMDYTDWSEALDDPRQQMNPVVQLGMVGVAVWQARPRWTRLRVRQYVEALDAGFVEFIAGPDTADGDDEGGEKHGPPAVAGEAVS